jgi:Tol biopolymer transport system component
MRSESVKRAVAILAALAAAGEIGPAAVARSFSVLIYSCGRGFSNLCQINSDGGGERQLTRDGNPIDYANKYHSPSVSRNGRKLVFLRGSKLYLLNRASGRRFGPLSDTASLARISPDGLTIGDLELYPAPPPALGLVLTACVYDKSRPARRVCEGSTRSFAFTNDGRVLASVSDQYDPAYGRNDAGICIFNPLTRSCQQFVAAERGRSLSDPAPSPDGRLLAVTRSIPGHAEGGIALYSYATGRLIRRLTTGTADSGPMWAPDGSRLAFVRGADSASPRIYTISVHGGRPRLLVARGRAVTWGA